ncbi:MAG: PAS domain-containing protein [Verrucomicrobia bacterium]|nr:MAG: PAS domain-containing protein [Verrucomicrobiota bacterium]
MRRLTRARWTRTCAACARSSARRRNISIRCGAWGIASLKGSSRRESAQKFLKKFERTYVRCYKNRVTLPLIILAIVALLALHFWWRAKLRRVREEWQSESAARSSREQADVAEAGARQDALFDSMIEGVLVLDETDRVEFVNRAFAQMFASVGVLRGKALLEAVRLHEIGEIVQRAHAEGRVIDHELRLPGEPERWLQVSAAVITNVERRRLGTILVFHDLTRIKKLEGTRQEFVANVSHELRTPLSHIKGYAETLLGGAKDNPEVATRFLQTIERNAERLRLLIEDLLTISEIESGRVRLDLQSVALNELVDGMFADFHGRAGSRDVKLASEVPELLVRADAGRLEQVLSNLLDNAVKYGKQGGNVVVGAKTIDGNMVEVSVRDDGPGLSAEACARVFERFYRVDKARSREQGGTGLGLSIVKHLVQSHGGRVWVESELGRGAKFCFTLPAA